MIDLNFPYGTMVGKTVPKNTFYKHLVVNTKIKQHFIDDVLSILWLYKLAPSTLNVADGTAVHEIVIFLVELKTKDCSDDVFLFIDKNMPRHVVFILEYEERYKILLNYKEWEDSENGHLRIVKTFKTEWLTVDQLSLSIKGQTMDAIYEVMVGQVSGFGTTKSEDVKRIVELEELITKMKHDVEMLQKKISEERQFNRQMELNGKARKLKEQIAQLQTEIEKIKRE